MIQRIVRPHGHPGSRQAYGRIEVGFQHGRTPAQICPLLKQWSNRKSWQLVHSMWSLEQLKAEWLTRPDSIRRPSDLQVVSPRLPGTGLVWNLRRAEHIVTSTHPVTNFRKSK